jgi:outer membrane biosynthesis protein TonB
MRMAYFKKLILLICIFSLSQSTSAQIKSTPMLKIDSTSQGLINATKALQSLQNGARTRESISEVVNSKVYALKDLYNDRLREKPNLKGKIKIKFAIDEFGKVIHSEIIESNTNDSIFEKELLNEVNGWLFHKIDKPGDVTEAIYPFVFKKEYSEAILCTVGSLLLILIPVLFYSQFNKH